MSYKREVYLIGKWCCYAIKIVKNKKARGISRVLYFSWRHCASALTRSEKPLPFIQPDGLPPDRQQPTPRLGRAALRKRAMRLGVGVHGLATRSSYGCRRRRRHRWALTPPFHPYRCPLRIAAVVFCYDLHELAPVWQFHQCGALCCPDFPPLPIHPKASEAAAEPPCFYLIEIKQFFALAGTVPFLKKRYPKDFHDSYATP